MLRYILIYVSIGGFDNIPKLWGRNLQVFPGISVHTCTFWWQVKPLIFVFRADVFWLGDHDHLWLRWLKFPKMGDPQELDRLFHGNSSQNEWNMGCPLEYVTRGISRHHGISSSPGFPMAPIGGPNLPTGCYKSVFFWYFNSLISVGDPIVVCISLDVAHMCSSG